MPDPIAPPAASQPAEAVELVSLAVSDGDLEAALAQYEAGAAFRPWAHDQYGSTDSVADTLIQLIDLRLPLCVHIHAIVSADGIALVLSERNLVGSGPDGDRVQLQGAGATVVRSGQEGSWRIVADAWNLDGPGSDRVRG